jgi:hypothetical protein
MLSYYMNINIICEPFIEITKCVDIKGFLFEYKHKKFIISIHHFLPISQIIDNNKNNINILINSNWSEILILEPREEDIYNNELIKNFNTKIPEKESILTVNNIKLIMNNIEMIPYNNIDSNNTIPYIIANIRNCNDINFSGFSGYPVFNIDNQLIGIFSKYNNVNNTVYILPIYILIKHFEKNNNIITTLSERPQKIKKYLVKNDYIYHKIFKSLSLNSYYLIEGDYDNYINTEINKEIVIQKFIKNDKIDDFTRLIQRDNDTFKITLRLLELLKLILSSRHFTILFESIIKLSRKLNINYYDIWLIYNNGNITLKI